MGHCLENKTQKESDPWWRGPEWLREPKEGWPERQELEESPESKDEMKKTVVSTVKMSDAGSIENVINVYNYSSRDLPINA